MAKNTQTTQAVETKTPETNKPTVDESKVTMYKGQLDQLYKDHKNHSGVIRYLSGEGCSTSEISQITGKRYQHVRNVLIVPVGKTAAR